MISLQIEHQRLSNLIDGLYQLRSKLIFGQNLDILSIIRLNDEIKRLEELRSEMHRAIDKELL